MKQEVVQDFLDLPGIVGVALMDGRSRPYFCGIDQFLNFQQKEALAQGIRQVIETTPASFNAFEFQFADSQIHIYKLDRGLILLVLTSSDLVISHYKSTIQQLIVTLQEDLSNAIATFRLLVGNATLSGQNYWNSKRGINTNPPKSTASGVKTTVPKIVDPTQVIMPPMPSEVRTSSPAIPSSQATTPTISLKEYVTALNALSQFSKQYLGTAVIVNYWKSSRPGGGWMEGFEVDRSGKIQYAKDATALRQEVNEEQKTLIRQWVESFVKRCAVVIRDFPALLAKDGMDDQERQLLL